MYFIMLTPCASRSFAILRSKPITLKKTPSLPTTRHPYEAPEIHTGFRQLISSYTPLDESFVNAWNEGSDPRVTAATYLALQAVLAMRPPFLAKARNEIKIVTHGLSTASHTPEDHSPTGQEAPPPSPSSPAAFSAGLNAALGNAARINGDEEDVKQENEPETTDIQKADLLITQQWLRLIVWQSSFRQQLLSWTAPDESMRFAFPLTIAARTAAVIQSLPPQAIEVHGMGIFEKIFEIGTWSMNVLQACDMASASGTNVAGGGAAMGMDFAGTSDMGVLGVGRMSYSVDPLEFFVRTLSASPNSRTQYAERLLMFANEQTGGGMRMALSPALSSPSSPELLPTGRWSQDDVTTATTAAGPQPPVVTDSNGVSGITGTILGEVGDDFNGVSAVNHFATTGPNGETVPFSFDANALAEAAFEIGSVAYDNGSLDGVVYDGTVSPTGVSVGGGSYGSIHGGSINEGISRNHSYGSFTEELQAGTDYPVFLPSAAQSPTEVNGFAGFDLSQTNLAS